MSSIKKLQATFCSERHNTSGPVIPPTYVKISNPIDLLRALVGVANVATSPDWQQSATRLVDILVTGARPIK
jgi:hypothetical protein